MNNPIFLERSKLNFLEIICEELLKQPLKNKLFSSLQDLRNHIQDLFTLAKLGRKNLSIQAFSSNFAPFFYKVPLVP